MDQDDVLFGNPKWLENFKEMKLAAIDPLYKDFPKQWMALHFNLQLLMLKSHHGWSVTSFNDLLRILANIYPEGNKVPTNTYRAKKMIWPVSMKLKKFHACSNHYILYRGKYDTYPEGNKVSLNTYRAKKMIQLVSMKLKKFHACSNHCIMYRGKYENLQSSPHCGASRYKRNVGGRADVDDEGPKSR